MKKINWKVIAITGVICLLPIILGIAVYDKLPNEIAIHFNINNEPDNFAPKALCVFGLPVLMLLLQTTCCIINDLSSEIKGSKLKLEKVVKGIIPALSVALYIITIAYALGNELDIRKIVCFIIGVMIMLIGNYFPKMEYSKARKGIHPSSFAKNEKVYRKISRTIGYTFVVIGMLFIISIFLPTMYSVAALILTIVSSIVISIYAIYLSKKNVK